MGSDSLKLAWFYTFAAHEYNLTTTLTVFRLGSSGIKNKAFPVTPGHVTSLSLFPLKRIKSHEGSILTLEKIIYGTGEWMKMINETLKWRQENIHLRADTPLITLRLDYIIECRGLRPRLLPPLLDGVMLSWILLYYALPLNCLLYYKGERKSTSNSITARILYK